METEQLHAREYDVTSAKLDWLTFTSVTKEYSRKLYMVGLKIRMDERLKWEDKKEWSAMGYTGYSCGHLKYGERANEESILILSGEAAHTHGFRANLQPERVTRVDVQVTVRIKPPNRHAAAMVMDNLRARYAHSNRRPFLNLIQSDSGDTVYVGRRDSEVSLRFYDRSMKMLQTVLGSCWRYEVQYRRKKAKAAYALIKEHSEPNLAVLGLVTAEFKKRHIIPGFGASSDIVAIEMGREVTTTEGKLKWLTKCVAPVVSQLVMAGFEQEVINALNLGAVVQAVKEKYQWQ